MFWCTEIHQSTQESCTALKSYTHGTSPSIGKLQLPEESNQSWTLFAHQQLQPAHKKTPSRRRASLWLPGTVEKCSNTEAQFHHEAPVHKHRFRHLNIRMLMRGTSRGLAHSPPASRNQMHIPYWWSEPMQVENCLCSLILIITLNISMRHWAKQTHVSKWMLLLIF